MIKIVSYRFMVFISWFSGRSKRPFDAFQVLGLPIIILKDKNALTAKLFKHEWKHIIQAVGLFWVGFWILYLIFHIYYGYENNPFEKAAYAAENESDWASLKTTYSWTNYL